MNDYAIQVDRISKQYRLGASVERYDTLRDQIAHAIKRPFRRAAKKADATAFWALQDVSFDVRPGEVIGVIGRNGAGKSTLLKVLSRITEPTKGRVRIRGRVGSLLEVGTGFHPELSGRENTYLNGAILGMSRREIDRKFDEIVDFSEVGKFIDTPVKHYSSGMHLRLAFAVAAHLEPEILLVDEVLAVGDLAFQRKCLGKMEEVGSLGRTVLFVSHNLGAVKELCQTSIVMRNGQVDFRGSAVEGVTRYTRSFLEGDRSTDGDELTTGWRTVEIQHQGRRVESAIPGTDPFVARATLAVSQPIPKARLYCIIHDSNGDCVSHHYIDTPSIATDGFAPGRYQIHASFPPLWLAPDAYTLHFKLLGKNSDGQEERHVSERVLLDITDTSGQMDGKVRARLLPPLDWKLTGV
ncbi:MAG: polysaccharide ABC transporter ATP-binding protein [Armatimonadota bacterium]